MFLPVVFSSSPISVSSCKYFTTNLYLCPLSHLILYIYCYLSLLLLHKFRLDIATLSVLFLMHLSSTWKKSGWQMVFHREMPKEQSLVQFFQPHEFIFYKSTNLTMSSPLMINTRNLISQAHVYVQGSCCHLRPLRSLMQPAAMMSEVHVTTRNHVDVCGLYCHQTTDKSYFWSSCWCPWSMLPPETMLLSLMQQMSILQSGDCVDAWGLAAV